MALGNLLGTVDGLLGSVEGLLGGVTGGATGGASASASGDAGVSASASNLLDVGALVETSPSIHVGTGDAGGADLSVAAPTAVGLTADVGHLDVGGLLHGIA
jgi:hypothetical protein